jgi:glycine/D-amino acid oxidase-like deaminating enzyme
LNASPPLTRKQPLRHDQPLWAASPRISVVSSRTPSSREYDVIIVGAGISGALMAHALAGKELKILVIDRRNPVRGSSLASTAMIQHEIDIPLHALGQIIGEKRAARVWQRSARAVEQLVSLVRDLELKCAFERRRTLFLAGEEYGARALKTEVEARSKAGIDAELLDGATLLERHGLDRTAAIDSAISASANPAQLTASILRNAKKHGVEIVAGSEIKDVRSTDDQVVVSTDDGQMIAARHVVFCTGYEFLESVANKSQQLISTWALASRPRLKRPEWLDSYLVWEGSDPYLYFRSTPDGRVIVGGEDEDGEDAYKDPAKAAQKSETLVEKLGDLTGIFIGKPDFTWSAAFGVTPNGLPMIGPAPGLKNVFVTMGFGGNGITFSQIAADIISGEILGHRDADGDLFPIQSK